MNGMLEFDWSTWLREKKQVKVFDFVSNKRNLNSMSILKFWKKGNERRDLEFHR
jgi:hypothetical protein